MEFSEGAIQQGSQPSQHVKELLAVGGGSYDRARCVSNAISTPAFVITFYFILLFQIVETIKHSEEDHLFGCLLLC